MPGPAICDTNLIQSESEHCVCMRGGRLLAVLGLAYWSVGYAVEYTGQLTLLWKWQLNRSLSIIILGFSNGHMNSKTANTSMYPIITSQLISIT